MTLNEFKSAIRKEDPNILAKRYVLAASTHVLPDHTAYGAFQATASHHFRETENAFVVGSGNWGYSLNPRKLWQPFSKQSDIDVALISQIMFDETWRELRTAHRTSWHRIGKAAQEKLKRNAENIYSGFASPLWIPTHGHKLAYEFRSAANKLSTKEIGSREVTFMIFRNEIETIDYYQRGFRKARKVLQDEI